MRDAFALTEALRRLALETGLLARMGEASKRIFDALDVRKSVEGTLAALHYCLDNWVEQA
jgi:hypothetical protein